MDTSVSSRTTDRTLKGRAALLWAVLGLSALAVAANLLLRPIPALEFEQFAAVQAARDGVWLFGLVSGFGTAVAYVAYGLTVCLLAPARGSVFATLGALCTGLGGIAFAMGLFSSTTLTWYATGAEAQAGQDGASVFASFVASPAHAFAPQIGGFLLGTVGIILLSIALWRSRSLPRVVAVAPAVLAVLGFFLDIAPLFDLSQALLMVSLVVIGGYMCRAVGKG